MILLRRFLFVVSHPKMNHFFFFFFTVILALYSALRSEVKTDRIEQNDHRDIQTARRVWLWHGLRLGCERVNTGTDSRGHGTDIGNGSGASGNGLATTCSRFEATLRLTIISCLSRLLRNFPLVRPNCFHSRP
jgi:hypothetical protein